MGTGSGRWARFVAPRVGHLHAIDASAQAFAVARENLAGAANVSFHHATTDTAPIAPESCDFGYSLGVLHHIPDTRSALSDSVRLLKPGGVMLVYLYYRFDNRPAWFRALWRVSDIVRTAIHRLPPAAKSLVTDGIALAAYWPLSRTARLAERLGGDPSGLPLAYYRHSSFATLRTDSRDRFGTPLEQRFTREEIAAMMHEAGLSGVRFSDKEPFWCAVGTRNGV